LYHKAIVITLSL